MQNNNTELKLIDAQGSCLAVNIILLALEQLQGEPDWSDIRISSNRKQFYAWQLGTRNVPDELFNVPSDNIKEFAKAIEAVNKINTVEWTMRPDMRADLLLIIRTANQSALIKNLSTVGLKGSEIF